MSTYVNVIRKIVDFRPQDGIHPRGSSLSIQVASDQSDAKSRGKRQKKEKQESKSMFKLITN